MTSARAGAPHPLSGQVPPMMSSTLSSTLRSTPLRLAATLAALALLPALASPAGATRTFSLPGDDVAIWNPAGEGHIEPAAGHAGGGRTQPPGGGGGAGGGGGGGGAPPPPPVPHPPRRGGGGGPAPHRAHLD